MTTLSGTTALAAKQLNRKFIGIERDDTESDIRFDNKILGQWFVTNVKHIWSFNNRYLNHIGAVKVHLHESNNIKEDIE